jgi:hypothetical protein
LWIGMRKLMRGGESGCECKFRGGAVFRRGLFRWRVVVNIGILLALEGFTIVIKLAVLLHLASSEWTRGKPQDS